MTTPWYETCGNTNAVFAVMHKIDTEIARFDRPVLWLNLPYGTIVRGAADFDPLVQADVRRSFLFALHRGDDPQAAGAYAVAEAAAAVKAHNAKRPWDVTWHRWASFGAELVPHLVARVERAAESGENHE